jgi:exonuclease VII small subunit
LEGVLTQILNKLENLEQGQTRLEKGQANLEKRQANLEQGQAKLEQGQANLEQGQEIIKKHGAILGALQTASEVHKAENDNLSLQMARLSGEMKAGFKTLNDKFDNLKQVVDRHEMILRKFNLS